MTGGRSGNIDMPGGMRDKHLCECVQTHADGVALWLPVRHCK